MKRLSSQLVGIGWAFTLGLALQVSSSPAWAAPESKGPAPGAVTPAQVGPARDSYDGPRLLLGPERKVKVGGYGSFGGAYTRLIGRDSGLASFEGALLLDHRLSLGLVGYAFTRTPGCASAPRLATGSRAASAALA